MIVIASSSFIIRKGLAEIVKEVQSGNKLLLLETTAQVSAQLTEGKVSLLIADAEIANTLHPHLLNNIQLIRIADKKPNFIQVDASSDDRLFLDEEEQQLVRKIKRKVALMDKSASSRSDSELSDRELDIVREVALGKTNKEIADQLFISTHTVITHRKNITRKLGIKTVSGLTVYALLNNLIKMGDSI